MNLTQVLLALTVISCVIQVYYACPCCISGCKACCSCYGRRSGTPRTSGYCCSCCYSEETTTEQEPVACFSRLYYCLKGIPGSKDFYSKTKCEEHVPKNCAIEDVINELDYNCLTSIYSLMNRCRLAYTDEFGASATDCSAAGEKCFDACEQKYDEEAAKCNKEDDACFKEARMKRIKCRLLDTEEK